MNVRCISPLYAIVALLALSIPAGVAATPDCLISAHASDDYSSLTCELDDQPFAAGRPAKSEAGSKRPRVEFKTLDDVSGERILQAIKSVFDAYRGSIDFPAGIRLQASDGTGDSLIVESLAIPGKKLREHVVVVDVADLKRRGLKAFRSAAAAKTNLQTFYYLHGDVQQNIAKEFFRTCDKYRISCMGHWGEAPDESLPAFVSRIRRDQVLPAISLASGNLWEKNGHYNRGIRWQPEKIGSTDKGMIVPLRFLDTTGVMPDEQVTFDITLRRGAFLKANHGKRVDWSIAGTDQRGSGVIEKDRTLHLEGLSLAAGEQYKNLLVRLAPVTWKLVYTRQSRATQPVPGTPVTEVAIWQHATDVGRINGGLAKADVVIDDLYGTTKVIHDCTGVKVACVAHEARVSPDGKKIAYSVGYGHELKPVYAEGVNMGIKEIPGLAFAELWIYDLETGKKKKIPNRPQHAIDRQPEWLNNNKIVFASNRGGTYPFKNPTSMHQGKDQYGRGRCFNAPYCVSQEYGYAAGGMSMQLWTMNIDGTEARNITPHEQMALAPAVMANGDILYSCWNSHENKSFDAASSHSNLPATSKNKWWLCRADGNGADATVILNGHKTTTLRTAEWLGRGISGGENRSQLRAIRSVAEVFRDKLAITNYYRSNHVGSLGIIYALDYDDPHVEGCSTARCYPHGESYSSAPGSGRYVPSSFVAVTPYGNDQDTQVRRDSKGRALGKAGYPAPLPNTDKEFLITHARGSCYEAIRLSDANRRAMGGEPTCQKGIYKVKVPMVTDPFDTQQMELLAGGDEWHVWDGRAIASYQDLFGQELPDQLEPLDANEGCYLEVVDARKAELYASAERYNWLSNLYQQCAFQGCAVNTENRKFHAKNIAALTVFLPEMWDFSYSAGKEKAFASRLSNTGHKSMGTLGSQPLMQDGSVKMRVPCETPLVMAGTDDDGMVIAYDVMLHSLRAGETRTCHGCHDGHSEERAAEIKLSAPERFADTLAAKTVPAMPRKTPPVTFAQVQPILEKRCSGCHRDMTNHDGLLYSRVAQDYEQFDWPWAQKQPGQGARTHVAHVLILGGGSGYAVGETLKFPFGAGEGAAGQIARVGPNGEIREIRLTAAGNNYPSRVRIGVNTARGKGARLTAMTNRWTLSRPYTSKWVSRFARDSLLYWKCVGKRMDGRSDSQYDNDINFGPAHNSGATKEECKVIGRWIDTGIQHIL